MRLGRRLHLGQSAHQLISCSPRDALSDGGSGIGYNSDMREVVGDSVLSAPMLEWGPVNTDFVNKILTDTWIDDFQAWPGAAEGAVKLMPTFSPRVDPATVQFVEQARKPGPFRRAAPLHFYLARKLRVDNPFGPIVRRSTTN